MTRFLPVMMLLVLAVGCERDFKAGTGYGPGVGYSGVGMTYSSGGGALPLEEIADGTSTAEDTATPQDTAGQDGVGSDVCEGTPAYCECVQTGSYEPYCNCLKDEATEHANETDYCYCHHIVCGGENMAAQSAYYDYCIVCGSLYADELLCLTCVEP